MNLSALISIGCRSTQQASCIPVDSGNGEVPKVEALHDRLFTDRYDRVGGNVCTSADGFILQEHVPVINDQGRSRHRQGLEEVHGHGGAGTCLVMLWRLRRTAPCCSWTMLHHAYQRGLKYDGALQGSWVPRRHQIGMEKASTVQPSRTSSQTLVFSAQYLISPDFR